jgi:hypothetical protein
MTSPSRRVASLTAGVICAAVASLHAGSNARAVDFVGTGLIYLETFVDDGYPTTPEVDHRGVGGLIGFSTPFFGSGPAYVGGVPHVHLDPASGFTGLFHGPQAFDPHDSSRLGLRGGYANFAVEGGGGSGSSEMWASFSETATTPLGALVVVGTDGATDSGQLVLSAPGSFEDVNLPTATVTAILSGAGYEIDLFVDRTAETAVASVTVDGFPAVETPVLALAQFARATFAGFAHGADLRGGSSTVDVDLTSFAIHALGVAIPTMGTPATALEIGAIDLAVAPRFPPPRTVQSTLAARGI